MSQTLAERDRHSFAVRLSLLFAALSVIIGTNLPYLPVWLDWAGLTSSEIAVITATPLMVRLVVSPMIAFAADRSGDHRKFLIGLSWAGLAALLALSQARGFAPILLWMLLFSLAWTTIMPLTETVAMAGVKSAGLDYGRMRLWGSLSFVAASLIGGWVVTRAGASSAIWLVIAGAVMTIAATHAVPRPAATGKDGTAGTMRRTSLADAASLAASRPFLLFLAAGGLTSATHAVFYTFGTLHWRALGLSTTWSGALWAISIAVEVALLAYSAAVLRRVGPVQLLVLGAAAAVLRWFAMGFDPPLILLVPLQVLHALTFGATHLGSIHYIGRTVPETQAGTAQTLYASVTGGIFMGGAMLASGLLYAAYAGRAYWAMAGLAVVALVAGLGLLRLSRQDGLA